MFNIFQYKFGKLATNTIVFGLWVFANQAFADTPTSLLPSETTTLLLANADYARLSEDVYNINIREGVNRTVTLKPGFELLNYEDDLGSGFTAATYKRLGTDEVIVSFGGTFAGENDINDLVADAGLLLGSGEEPPQQQQAIQYVRDVLKEHSFNDVSLTGHSLGGSLAQYAGLVIGLETVTFNSGPVPFLNSVSNLDSSNITNLRTLDDPLSIILTLAVKLENGSLTAEQIAFNIDEIKSALEGCRSVKCTSARLAIQYDEVFNGRDAIAQRISQNRYQIIGALKDAFGVPSDTPISDVFVGENYFLALTGGGHSIDFILTNTVYQENLSNLNNLNAISETDLSFSNAEPIIGEVAQEGTINEFIALAGNDLQNEQTVLVAEFASPDDDTGTPGVDGGGDEGGGGEDGGQDGDRDDPLSSENTVRSFVAAVSLDTEGPETGWQFVALEDLSEDTGELTSIDIDVPAGQASVTTTGSPRGSQYSHLQYGVSTDTTTFVRNGQTFEASNAHWLYGNFTSPSNLALRTGTASYAGELFGHAYDVEGPDLSAAFNSVTGDFTLSVDFSTNRASLEGNVVGLGSEPLSFSGGLNRDFYDLNEGERPSVVVSDVTDVGLIGITTQANLAFPVELDVPGRTSSSGQDDGYLYGSFFGDNASEFGGTFAFALDDTLATGVAVASRSDTLGTGFAIFQTADDTVARRGGITVTELNTSTLSAETTGSSLNELESVTVNTADLDNGSFSYVSWGSWGDTGSYLGQDVSSGTIAFGRITPEENMPSGGTRNFGTATANSQVAGLGADGSTIDGSVQLTAEFGASRGGLNGVEVNGSFDFDRNGSDWASGTFTTENDVLRANGFSADMTVDQGGDGRMFGNFAGPNAEEVFGNWQLNGVNNADLGSAQGIFRAN